MNYKLLEKSKMSMHCICTEFGNVNVTLGECVCVQICCDLISIGKRQKQ